MARSSAWENVLLRLSGRAETGDAPPGYICDIGIATSADGIHFTKDTKHSPFFRKGEDSKYSFEDVSLVKFKNTFYLFCNRWDWSRMRDPKSSGAFLATSKNLKNWKKIGLVFPHAQEIHRNPVILRNPQNEAVRVNSKFVMYLNFGVIAYSDDLIHWTSKKRLNNGVGSSRPSRLGSDDLTKTRTKGAEGVYYRL